MGSAQTDQTCSRCGAPLEEGQPDLCLACAMAAADARVEARPATPEPEAKRLRGVPPAVLYAICILCLVVIAWRGPAFVQSLQPQHPIRTGIYTTKGDCDACVENLWMFSAALIDGNELPADLVCPATSKPYVVTASADGTVVSCPNPDEHGLSALLVGRGVRIPEAQR